MIGVFSSNVEKYATIGQYTPCLTADVTNQYVFGRNSKSNYGPVVPVLKKQSVLCDNPHPPENALVILTSHCKGKAGGGETYWINVDTGSVHEPVDGVHPLLWPTVSTAQLKGFFDAYADAWSSEDIDFLINASISDKLEMLLELNGMATPKPILPTNPYKWILKNGVVSFPEPVAKSSITATETIKVNKYGPLFTNKATQKEIYDLLNSLTTSTNNV